MKIVHIGDVICEKLEESNLSIAEFASCINRTRTTIYDIFKRKSIDTDLLLDISEVLGYNFLEEVYIKKNDPGTEAQHSKHYMILMEVDERQLNRYISLENVCVMEVIRSGGIETLPSEV